MWYREMVRDGVTNRLYKGNVDGKEEQDHVLRPHGPHTPTNLYLPPTPSESTPPLSSYVVQDAGRLTDLTLSDRPTVLPQDHDHSS
jgi:hypothetical protein